MKSPLDRIRQGAVVFFVTVIAATFGYHLLFGREWIDALYLVVITVTSVGFTDANRGAAPTAAEQLFTIGVIAVGMTAGAYAIGGFFQLMTEGEIQRALGRRRMTREIDKLSNHVIVCGFGRIGQILTHDLERRKVKFVVVEIDVEAIDEAAAQNYLVVSGDATEETTLHDAGIERARSLVSALPSDANNVFITLTARNLNPQIQIVARAEHRSSEKKLLQAGASRVVMPASTGAIQMAQMITRPTAADFFEILSNRSQIDLAVDEVKVLEEGPLLGKTVAAAEANRRHHLLVLAIKQADGNMVFNPGGDYTFIAGDTLILMGNTDNINRFEQEFGLGR